MSSLIIRVTACLVLLAASGFADEKDAMRELLTKESRYRCGDYMLNCSKLVPQYYRDGKLDSLRQILKFVEDECGMNDRIMRTKILMAAHDNEFNEDIYDERIIGHLLYQRWVAETINEHGYEWTDYYTGIPADVNEDYDKVMKELARDAVGRYDSTTVEHLFGLFYSGEFKPFYDRLKSPDFRRADLRHYYDERIDELSSDRGKRPNYAFSFGGWFPTGNLDIFGMSPHIGATMGGMFGRIQTDLTFSFAWGWTDSMYYVEDEGVLDSTDAFSAFYIGLDLGYRVGQLGPVHISVLAGLGYGALHTIQDPQEDDKKVVLGSLDLNGGFGTRLYLSKYQTWYIELNSKLHIVNFDTRAGTDLSGNYVTFGVTVGHLGFGQANKTLQALNYFD